LILDLLAEQEKLNVEQDEIGQYVAQLAYQQGVPPDQFARQLTSSGQLGAVVSDVLRSKAADLLAERVKVADESGRKVVIGGADADTGTGDSADESGDAAVVAEAAGAQDEAEAKPKGRGRRGRKDSGQPEADKPEAVSKAE